jgi:hypothetical protein
LYLLRSEGFVHAADFGEDFDVAVDVVRLVGGGALLANPN